MCYKPGKVGYIDGLFVDEAFRRQRIGQDLINDYYAYCTNENIDTVVLTTRTKNEKAVSFYKSLGFEADQVEMFKKI